MSEGERVVMEKSIGSALNELFKDKKITGESQLSSGGIVEVKNEGELIEEANTYYNLILDSMNQQDWTGIGNNFGKLGEVLNILSER